MKNLFSLLILSSIFLFISSCKKEYIQNEEFNLKYNKSAIVNIDGEELDIKFEQIVKDSRCPPNVNCYTAGFVTINIKVNNSDILTLGEISPYPPTATYGNHTITLIDVGYNKDKNFGKEKCASITLKVN